MNMGKRLRALYEEHMRIKRDRLYLRNAAIQEGLQQGRQEGLQEGLQKGDLNRYHQAILDLLEDLGDIPEDICRRIQAETDTEILRKWHKAAARSESFADFRSAIE